MNNDARTLEVLRMNGITKSSSEVEIEKIFTALKYSPEERASAMEFLKKQGYMSSVVTAPVLASTQTQQIPPTPQSPINPAPVAPVASSYVPNYPQAEITEKPKRKLLPLLSIIVVILVLVGGGLYAYKYGLLPFGTKVYSESNLLSGLLAKGSEINSSTYELKMELSVNPREKDAIPFAIKNPNEAKLREQYQNDVQRLRDAQSIVRQLSYSLPQGSKTSNFPSTISQFDTSKQAGNRYSYSTISTTDPATKKPYKYSLLEGGKNFALTVNFETPDAIRAIKISYGFSATSTIINGKEVTFNKNSQNLYTYMSEEPPQPFFAQIGEYTKWLTVDTNAQASVGATSDWTDGSLGDWKFNFDASGSFGDLTYKVNADAIKKNENYFIKINNIPSLFLGEFSNLKGQWIKIPTKTATSTGSFSMVSYFSEGIPDAEKEYKEKKAEFVLLLKKAAEIAGDEKLIKFKSHPVKENVDGRELTRYELSFRKEAILPFYEKYLEEVRKTKDYHAGLFDDEGLLEYLKSSEFDQTFDYYDKNTKITLWVDGKGFPALIEYSIRIVPPDSAPQLKDKQVDLVTTLKLEDINKKVDIEEPKDAKDINKVSEDLESNYYNNPSSQAASLKSSLSSVRAKAEVVYSNTNYSGYGTSAFPLGPCSKKLGTLFGDNDVFTAIEKASSVASKATCVSTLEGGKVTAYAVSVPLPESTGYSWCVDSSGNSRQVTGAIKSASCR